MSPLHAGASRPVTFIILLVTQTLSLVGSYMTSVAVGLWVFQQTGLTAPLLLTAFFRELPGMLGGSLAGVLVDRWNRKTMMLLADSGQAAASLLLLVSFYSGQFQLWHLYAVALLQGIFVTFQSPVTNATVTLLVPEAQRERANGLKELADPVAGVAAPVFAGLVYAVAGVTGVLVIDLVTFVLAVCVVLLLAIPQPPPSQEGRVGQGSLMGELRAGFQFLRRRKPLLWLILFLAWINFLLNGPLEMSLPYLASLTGNEQQMGLMMGVMSLGAFTGGLLVAGLGRPRRRMRLILAGLLFNGALFLAYGTLRSLPLLGVAAFLLMLPLPAGNALYVSLIQAKTPPDLQGRVFALADQFYLLGSTLSFLLIGPLVDRVLQPAVGTPGWAWVEPLVGSGPGSAIGLLQVLTGLLILLTTALFFSLRSVRRLDVDLPDHPVPPVE